MQRQGSGSSGSRSSGSSRGGRSFGRGGSRRPGGRSRYGRRPFRSPKFQNLDVENIDYKNLALLQKFLTDRGKMLSHRVTGVTTAQQRKIGTAIKRARFLGLLPVGVIR